MQWTRRLLLALFYGVGFAAVGVLFPKDPPMLQGLLNRLPGWLDPF